MNTDAQTTATGHMFYSSGYENANDVLIRIGSELEEGGCYDLPNTYNSEYSSEYKITVTVEKV